MKPKSVSPSVAIILGKAKADPKSEDAPEEAEAMDGDDAGWASLGKAVRAAMESKDDAALGHAIKDIVEYCQPEAAAEGE